MHNHFEIHREYFRIRKESQKKASEYLKNPTKWENNIKEFLWRRIEHRNHVTDRYLISNMQTNELGGGTLLIDER